MSVRFKAILGSALLAVVLLGTVAATQYKKYGVTTTFDKKTDFAAIRTYAWTLTHPALSKDADRVIVAAVDRELGSLGLTRVEREPSDVIVTYATLNRTDVDTKSHAGPDGRRPQYLIGTLIVSMRVPGTQRTIFQARADTPIDFDGPSVAKAINEQVPVMFAKYPTRRR